MNPENLASVSVLMVTVPSDKYGKPVKVIFDVASRTWVYRTTVEIKDAIGRSLLIQDGAAEFVLANGTALPVCSANASCAAATRAWRSSPSGRSHARASSSISRPKPSRAARAGAAW